MPDRSAPADRSRSVDRSAAGRVTLVLTSPRTAVGLLSWPAWERLRSADRVLAVDPDPAWLAAFEPAGVTVTDVAGRSIGERAGQLVQDAEDGLEVVWWGSPDGDPGLTDALAEHLSRRSVTGVPPEVELLTGSHDVPGARVLDLVAVMDTLRSPGGSAWDQQQTHTSLLPYLLEEAYEVIEAVETGDRDHLVEELGDLLLQVVYHARLGEEHSQAPFGIDDVAAGIVAKLIRRKAYVFQNGAGASDGGAAAGDGSAAGGGAADAVDGIGGASLTVEEVERRWDETKAAEKQGRGAFEGIPLTLPALARAQKMIDRLQRAAVPDEAVDGALAVAAADDELTAVLLTAVRSAHIRGIDAESHLRAALARFPSP